MNNPLGASPSKGNQGTTRGKEKILDLGGNRTHKLRITHGFAKNFDNFHRVTNNVETNHRNDVHTC